MNGTIIPTTQVCYTFCVTYSTCTYVVKYMYNVSHIILGLSQLLSVLDALLQVLENKLLWPVGPSL